MDSADLSVTQPFSKDNGGSCIFFLSVLLFNVIIGLGGNYLCLLSIAFFYFFRSVSGLLICHQAYILFFPCQIVLLVSFLVYNGVCPGDCVHHEWMSP